MKKKFFLYLFAISLTLPAMAYDAFGHRIIAGIAYENLTCHARKKVDKMLGKHGLIYVSTWSDDVRSDSAYAYSYDWHFQNLRDGMNPTDILSLYENPKNEGIKWFGKDIRLHQLWDTQMIEGRNYSYSEYVEFLQDKFAGRNNEFKKQSLPQSLEAVYQVRNKIYKYDYNNLRAYNYMYVFNNDLDELLYRGGIQLANLLNKVM